MTRMPETASDTSHWQVISLLSVKAKRNTFSGDIENGPGTCQHREIAQMCMTHGEVVANRYAIVLYILV